MNHLAPASGLLLEQAQRSELVLDGQAGVGAEGDGLRR